MSSYTSALLKGWALGLIAACVLVTLITLAIPMSEGAAFAVGVTCGVVLSNVGIVYGLNRWD